MARSLAQSKGPQLVEVIVIIVYKKISGGRWRLLSYIMTFFAIDKGCWAASRVDELNEKKSRGRERNWEAFTNGSKTS